MPLEPFRSLLQRVTRFDSGSPKCILADGGIGTELLRRGVGATEIIRANLDFPDLVSEIHESYVAAGSGILTTNTFGVQGNLSDGEFAKALRAGIELAFEVAESSDEPVAIWISLAGFNAIDILRLQGFDLRRFEGVGVLLETCVSLSQALDFCQQFHEIKGYQDRIPTCATFHFGPDGLAPDGSSIETIAYRLPDAFELIGANCGSHPEEFPLLTKRFRDLSRRNLIMQPNLGIPRVLTEGDLFYPASFEDYEQSCLKSVFEGARIVGGCCGVAPAHIAHLHQKLTSQGCLE